MPKTCSTGPTTATKPAVKAQLIEDSDSEGDSSARDSFHSAAEAPEEGEFKINAEYAKRFEYNKKREELARLEEKYGPNSKNSRDNSDSDDSDTDASDEDDHAVLATVELDNEIAATLAAIRKKDPRVYDGKTTFYTPIPDADAEPTTSSSAPAEKPIYLRDYHLSNLLNKSTTEEDAPQTFVQEQADLKRTVVASMHQATTREDEDDEGFLVRKSTTEVAPAPELPDPALADKDPEEFLDKFLSSRAWAQTSAYPALESDDSDHDDTAEAFEKAYNFRFENPSVDARAVLTSYGRDAITANTVRREEKSSRKKAREAKREKREREKEEREREKGRLKKLKMEELLGKFKMIREAAGLEDGEGNEEEVEAEVLEKLLEGEWTDEAWEDWMKGRFGDEYYDAEGKVKKPEFEDDIDIGDIVSDFEDDAPPALDDDDDDEADEDGAQADDDDTEKPKRQRKDKKSIQKEERKKKQKDKALKRKLEAYVDDTLDFTPQTTGFRYRQTTPETYGLTPLDILTATDQDLNTFVGLKKLATFREPDKKKKDKKRYGKKKRLREWRKEVFGDEEGIAMPTGWKPEGLKKDRGEKEKGEGEVDIREADGERKKKRRKQNKS